MTLTQLNPTKETLWDVLTQPNVYLVRFSESRAKRADGRKREVAPYPYGLSFRNVEKMTLGELSDIINEGTAIVVELKLDDKKEES